MSGFEQTDASGKPAAKDCEVKAAGSTRKRGKKSSADTKQAERKPREKQGTDAEEGTQTPVSRKDLLEKALSIIEQDLSLDGDERPTNTIANLVQLLKLDRSFREDEEQPHEIRVVWQEKMDETFDDSTGRLPET